MNSPAAVPQPGRVLVVDDDRICRVLVERNLKRDGHEITHAANADEARQVVEMSGPNHFECIVTDFNMPMENGLDLIRWAKMFDGSLAAVVVTAYGEKQVVADSLRLGACGYLEKPIQGGHLRDTVHRAIAQTRRDRHLIQVQKRVRAVSDLQRAHLAALPDKAAQRLSLIHQPVHEVGGDSLMVLEEADDAFWVVCTDVSGHDLKAGFVSAYFQGVVRGMHERGTPMSRIFEVTNRLLLREWPGLSVAACAVGVNPAKRELVILNGGAPFPVLTHAGTEPQWLEDRSGLALGWFDENAVPEVHCTWPEDSAIYLWTDGLEELAFRMGVSPFSVAHVLERNRRGQSAITVLPNALDDLVFVRVRLGEDKGSPAGAILFHELYRGNQSDAIDKYQADWRRSLKLVLPDLPDRIRHDLLLSAREAVLNAMNHGCCGLGDRYCQFRITLEANPARLIVTVADPGKGCPCMAASGETAQTPAEDRAHRGLALVQGLPTATRFDRHGASVNMDFALPPQAS